MRRGRQKIADQWKLYVILGGEKDPLKIADAVLRSGARVLQYRGKGKPGSLQLSEAIQLRKLTHKNGANLIVNDRADIAFLAGADGLHLGEEDLPIGEARRILGMKKLIGATVHSLDEAARAEKEGADYIGFGSVFHTSSKKNTTVRGLSSLARVVRRSRLPVIGIGGIQYGNIHAVMETGVAGVAALSAITASDNPEAAAREMMKQITCRQRQGVAHQGRE